MNGETPNDVPSTPDVEAANDSAPEEALADETRATGDEPAEAAGGPDAGDEAPDTRDDAEVAPDAGLAAHEPTIDEIAPSSSPVLTVPPTTEPSGDVARAHLKGLVEALVFASERPLTVNEIAKAASAERKLVKALADELRAEYAGRGIRLDEVAGGWVFRTSPTYAPFIRDAVAKKPVRMSRAQIETLAIVAYKQPITRPEVDEVRGVDCGPVLKMLLERDLVKILGKKDEPGRPLLYGTTPAFLEMFGLKSLKDLPTLREFTELSDDSLRVLDRELGDANLGVGAAPVATGPAIDPAEYEADPTDVPREGAGADAPAPDAAAPTAERETHDDPDAQNATGAEPGEADDADEAAPTDDEPEGG